MGNTDELFSQILWSYSQIILFIQQINWLLLPTVQQCIVGLNCPIIDCRHTTSLSLGFAILMKNSQIYFFQAPLKYFIPAALLAELANYSLTEY